ncbi:MAG: hypothetical protein M3Q83_02705 [Pseudomonadota bacterium]|nr:hypothetical protein [Pseudomonadota bacterium]
MTCRILYYAVGASLLLAGCSSRPREFTPTLGIATAERAGFDQAYATCTQLMVAGKLNQEGRSSSLGAGAAAGATTAAVGAGAVAAIGPSLGALAAASATVVLLPFAVIGGAWGMAKMKRAKKEAAIKEMVGGCLQERGYSVASWEEVSKNRTASRTPSAN